MKISELTEEQIQWLKGNYHDKQNEEIASYLGISLSSLRKLRIKYGLKKDKEFLVKIARSGGTASKNICSKNGYKAQKENITRLWLSGKLKHVHVCHWHSLSDEEKKKVRQKMSENRKKLIEEEKKRVRWGLPPRTKLNMLNEPNRSRSQAKYKLIKKGYIFLEKWVFGYNSKTQMIQEKTKERYEQEFRFKFIEQ